MRPVHFVAARSTPIGRLRGALSAARILITLLHRMRRTGARRGLVTMCVGVGQGTAVLVERD